MWCDKWVLMLCNLCPLILQLNPITSMISNFILPHQTPLIIMSHHMLFWGLNLFYLGFRLDQNWIKDSGWAFFENWCFMSFCLVFDFLSASILAFNQGRFFWLYQGLVNCKGLINYRCYLLLGKVHIDFYHFKLL